MKYYLKLDWTFAGLNAPVFSWAVSAFVLLYCLYVVFIHWRRSLAIAAQLNEGRKAVEPLLRDTPHLPGKGLSLKVYDSLYEIFTRKPTLAALWHKIEGGLIRRSGEDKTDEFWLVEPIEALVNEGDFYQTDRLKSAPGIITAIGLLATFVAILIALLDVRLEQHRIQGLDLLIQGLSGKFLSSIVALACAVALLWLEHSVQRPLQKAFEQLRSTIKETLPRITTAQILSDLRDDIAEQVSGFRVFNADLSLKLRQSFGESIGPTLERMVQAVDELNQFMRKAEESKRESIIDQLASLLRDLEESMRSSLEKMGQQFTASLSGDAQAQFTDVAEALGQTTSLLRGMNQQFTTNQAVLNELISFAKSATREQLSQGQAQVQDLTAVLKDLMIQLQEKTGESLGSVQQALATVTIDISNKVAALGVQMATIIEETSGRSAQAAKDIIDRAGTLSSESAESLRRLLDKHSGEITRIEDLTILLDSAIKGFSDSTERYGETTKDVNKFIAEINIAVASVSHISNSIRDVQATAARVSELAASQIDSLRDVTRAQKETWENVQTSMLRYNELFAAVERQGRELLSHLGNSLQNYSQITQEHFNKFGTIANDHIANATERIAGAVDELGIQLEELQGVVDGIADVLKRVDGNGRA